jgi:non-ribosomal peptide synthase protein (TIGR01720 family)
MAQRFISNPLSDKVETRLYKTGDRVRYRVDGILEFCDRIDNQVKIRGFRIELAEIEIALRQHPSVQEGIVLVRADQEGDQRLIAYVVFSPAQTPTISDLHRFLKQKLPDYMVPSAFVILEALPLTPNGKVDRQALPTPDTARPDLDTAYAAPRSLPENVLAQIWSEVLGVAQVGIHDNFFELGGDSILTLQVITRAKQMGWQLTPKQIFQHQTIAELAAVADTTRVIQAQQEVVTGSVPLTPIQHWFFAQNLPNPHHWNQAVLLEVQQGINPAILQQAFQHLLIHHDALRLRFVKKESNWQQVNAGLDKVLSLTHLDLSASDQQEAVIEATLEELQPTLNLSEAPLMRVVLFDLGVQTPSRLLIIIHHLIIDGVSWGILLEDLHTAYQQLSRGAAIQLPLKTTAFKQWSERLQDYAQSAQLQQELSYWLAESRKSITPFPVDNPGGSNTVASSATVSVTLSAEETQILLQDVPQIYRIHIEDLLTTTVALALAQWTGEQTLLIDLEGSGRDDVFNDLNLSRTVGWFTTLFPVLLDLKNATHPAQALTVIKEQLRSISHQGIGYGLLRYLSQDITLTQQLQTLPQAQIVFYYLGQLDRMIPQESMFELTHFTPTLSRSPQGNRSHLLECISFVMNNQLQLDWTYSQTLHQPATIEHLANACIDSLRSLITHRHSSQPTHYTPSDFPDIQLSPEKLDKLFAEIDLF